MSRNSVPGSRKMIYQAARGDISTDKERILEFWRKNHDKSFAKKFDWMYERNPFGKPHIWFIELADSKELVGMGVIFPRHLEINGIRYAAGILGDMLVHKAHRSLGPALLLQKSILRSLEEGGFELIYGFPNKNAEIILRRSGYVCLGRLARSVLVLRSESYLKRISYLAQISKPFSLIIDFFIKIRNDWNFRHDSKYLISEDYSVFDERFEDLWRKKNELLSIVPVRTSQYMKWKFRDDPDDKNYVFALLSQDALELKGCVIYRIVGQRIEIREFIVANEFDEGALMSLFIKRIKVYNPINIFVSHIENKTLAMAFGKMGFRPGVSRRNAYIITADNPAIDKAMCLQKDNWMLMGSDEDT